MKNYNSNKNVYEASQERIKFIFDNFERIYVSFSGGKDSGVMLNLMLDYMRANNITEKIGIMILDNEANYNLSLEFMHKIMQANRDLLDIYWCCLPITLPCTVSSYATEWQCWGVNDEKRWISPMPKNDYVVNIKNHNFPFFKENMSYDEFWDDFAEMLTDDIKTLLGGVAVNVLSSAKTRQLSDDEVAEKNEHFMDLNIDIISINKEIKAFADLRKADIKRKGNEMAVLIEDVRTRTTTVLIDTFEVVKDGFLIRYDEKGKCISYRELTAEEKAAESL